MANECLRRRLSTGQARIAAFSPRPRRRLRAALDLGRRWRCVVSPAAGGSALAEADPSRSGEAKPSPSGPTGAQPEPAGDRRGQRRPRGAPRGLVAAHRERHGDNPTTLFVGLQLTHSGRYARPTTAARATDRVPASRARCGDSGGIRRSRARPTTSSTAGRTTSSRPRRTARAPGFDFVDVKHCHGYLGHELLSARRRPGRYGGTLENRTRFLRDDRARGFARARPGCASACGCPSSTCAPYAPGAERQRRTRRRRAPMPSAFGLSDARGSPPAIDDARRAAVRMLESLGVRWVCATAGSPYYNPHIQRPALSRRPTATCRPRIRSSASRGRSTRPRA